MRKGTEGVETPRKLPRAAGGFQPHRHAYGRIPHRPYLVYGLVNQTIQHFHLGQD